MSIQNGSGNSIVLALAILLEGAVSVIEKYSLNTVNIETTRSKQEWRNKLLTKTYWVKPFSNINILRDGIKSVVVENGGDDIPDHLTKLLKWISSLEDDNPEKGYDVCKIIKDKLLLPSIEECSTLIEGNLPA